jgi:hypothetical protein
MWSNECRVSEIWHITAGPSAVLVFRDSSAGTEADRITDVEVNN